MIFSKSCTSKPFPCSIPASILALALAIISSIAALTFSRAAFTTGLASAILASTIALSLLRKSTMLPLTSPDSILALSLLKISLMCWATSMISVIAIYSAGFNLSMRSPRCLLIVGMRFSMACFNAGLRTSLRRSSKILNPTNSSLSSANLAMIFAKSCTSKPLPCSMPASMLALALAIMSSMAAFTFSRAAFTTGFATAILASTTAFNLLRKSTMLALTSPDSILALSWLKMSLMCWAISMISDTARYSTYSLGTSLPIRSPRCFWMVGIRFSIAFPRAGFKTSLRRSSKIL